MKTIYFENSNVIGFEVTTANDVIKAQELGLFICNKDEYYVTENRKIGFTAVIHLLVEGRYRKINWENLTSEEKERVQNALNL